MFWSFLLKEWALTRRNVFILLIFLFPLLTAMGGSGIQHVYSPLPKLVVLEQEVEHYDGLKGLEVMVARDDEQMRRWVFDLDHKIGIKDGELVVDGREAVEDVEKMKSLLQGEKVVDVGADRQRLFNKVFAFNLYGTFMVGAMVLLFKLVEERERFTTELQKTQPAHPLIPLLAKVTITAGIVGVDFLLCGWILNVPLKVLPLVFILASGVSLGIVLGLILAFYATNESQALAILKPVVFVGLMGIPALGLFMEGWMHQLALFNPFYWLLLMVNDLYQGEFSGVYFVYSMFFCLVGLGVISRYWYKTLYGIPKVQR
ncbi:ABC transporter permease [Ammoniphilus sp. CFH 90114]|uniref:ABC transporter permease n=1 Tax=Ammoniphilus sp. CFH 90114 TaxID=2493665 RepID=UPI0013E8FAD4|nr:ABC transporter permease [Ammoniphilus sp. CFH 90114]